MANDLNLPTIADGQADQQWQTSNDADASLADAVQDILTVDFSGGDVTLTSAQFRSAMTFIPSGLSATRALTVPAVKRAQFFVHNTDASDSITVTRGATTVSVAAGKLGVFYTDGTANGLVGAIVTPGVGGVGDVVGPASVTDGNPTVFDTTTGKLIKQRTFTQFTASLDAMVGDSGSGGTKGLAPAPGAGDAAALKFLKADGTWAVPSGSGASTSTDMIAGAGLTGGGTLAANRTFAVGAGTGIGVNADDVQITAAYQAVGKQTIWVPASAMISATTNGPASAQLETSSNKVNYSVLDFDATTSERAHFNVAFPNGWDEGTVTFQAFWSSTATDTDGVAISLEGVAISDNEAIDASWGTAVTVTDDAQSAAGELYVTSESTAVTIAGTPAEGDLCYFRVSRVVSDGNDDMSEDMRLVGIKLFYTTNAANDA